MASSKASLHAAYTAPCPPTAHTFAAPLSSAPTKTQDVQAKTAYLAELRSKVTVLQGDINVFLTERMEEDKTAAEAQGRTVSEQEAKEEENYGEERGLGIWNAKEERRQ
ncbi:hypothetical protein ASPZODRAFT_1888916 [Penicilliopsis zonata CBS 506.65]|uniref:EKC/KEOPS complex subunit GON7 n=1 Tax=Penicilliopsis zonata CBS 506.65 TaxID=1073090 RepID=A0A1L9SIL0_9EURO|nr:hypothetical protein ASPZODRAFT_1888916 [Penicilliopsis zonata CBS 506.65]OJJ47070.1 hypothetical protein ASPZODRAFT_1888916 [Penicilliopsis zonata CBS 506.65]